MSEYQYVVNYFSLNENRRSAEVAGTQEVLWKILTKQ